MNQIMSLITNRFLPSAEHEDEKKVIRDFRDLPPAHYLFKIENFSQLSYAKTVNFKSSDFEVGGYKWRLRLCFYTNGKCQLVPNEESHLSLYLVLSESNVFSIHQEVNVYFKLFLYQIHDKYLTVQDAKGKVRRFHGMKMEWGFDEMLPFNIFNDTSNGYLISDSCTFGAEVFIVDSNTRIGNCASLATDLGVNNYIQEIGDFEKMKEKRYISRTFTIGGHKWRLLIYPNGCPSSKGRYVSLYLRLEDSKSTLKPGDKLNVAFTLRIKNQLHENDHQCYGNNVYFSSVDKSLGYPRFMPLNQLKDRSNGYIVNGAIIIGVTISSLTVVTELS